MYISDREKDRLLLRAVLVLSPNGTEMGRVRGGIDREILALVFLVEAAFRSLDMAGQGMWGRSWRDMD